MTTPDITLHYFDAPGRAEYLRLALSITGTPFRDHRLSEDEFVQMKKDGKLPYGVVPILEVKNAVTGKVKVIAESAAILTWICLERGDGTLKQTDTDNIVRVAEVCSLMYDLMDRIGATVTVFASPAARLDDKKKLEMREELKAHVFPSIFGGLEHTLQPNGYVVGNSISAADLLVQRACKWLTAGVLDGIPTTCLDAYEKTRKCVQNVDEHPRVKEYYANKQQLQKA